MILDISGQNKDNTPSLFAGNFKQLWNQMTYNKYVFVNNFNIGKTKKARTNQLSQIRSHAARSISLNHKDEGLQGRFMVGDIPVRLKDVTRVAPPQSEDKTEVQEQVPTPRPGFGCYRTETITSMPNWTKEGVGQAVDLWFQCLHTYEGPLWGSCRFDDLFQFMPKSIAEDPVVLLLFLAFFKDTSDAWHGAQLQSNTVIACQNQAIAFLRERLQLPDSEQDNKVLYAIGLLASRAYVAGDLDQYSLHWQQFVRLADMRNLNAEAVFADIQHTASSMLFIFDSLCILESNKSVFPKSFEASGHASKIPSPSVRQLLERCPEGFVQLSQERQLSDYVFSFIAWGVSRFIDNGTGPVFFERKVKKPWTQREYLRCPGLGMMDSSWDRLIGLAIITFHCSVLEAGDESIGPFSFHSARTEMTRRVGKIHSSSIAEFECRIWLYMVAINAWRDADDTGLEQEGRRLLKDFRWRFGFSLWEPVEEVLMRFFWTPCLTKWWKLRWDVLD